MEAFMALMIPIIALCIPMVAIWTKHQQKLAEITANAAAEKAAQYATNNADLEERVRVLERIVTDKGYDVASQIEALRDARKVEALLDKREKDLS
jgi:predicted ArsR family transcriptional regulator